MSALDSGATIGILGGGQLGRMLAMAAAHLGYRTCVLAPEADPPAAQVANRFIQAAYDDEAALDRLGAAADVITYEFENVPHAVAMRLADARPVRPGPKALAVTQDRLHEKDFLDAIGVPVAPHRAVDSARDLEDAAKALGLPAVLKTRRLGYDGKGQAVLHHQDDLPAAWQ
ncbi:MAG: ATP-grasp domain-containing protein, partial [Alphaproteobacteria bacterium]